MQTSSPPVITPIRSQSNSDDMITLLRPIQSVGMDLHDVSGIYGPDSAAGKKGSTGHPLLSDNLVGIPTICYYFYPPPTIVHFFIHFCPKYTPFDHSSTLKRRPQTSVTAADLVWVCAPPRTIRKWLRRLAFWILRTRAQDPCNCCCRPGEGLRPAADHPQMVTTPGVLDPADPGARSLQLLLQTWCGSAPRRGPSANGYDAWRFGSKVISAGEMAGGRVSFSDTTGYLSKIRVQF